MFDLKRFGLPSPLVFDPAGPQVAGAKTINGNVPVCVGMVGLQGEGVLVARQCFIISAHFIQAISAIAVGFSVIGSERNRMIKACERLIEARSEERRVGKESRYR